MIGTDLHCHTTLSDGFRTAGELADLARARGLRYVAVTDHDAVNREARALLDARGIGGCEAVEISARDYGRGHSLHLALYAKIISRRVEEALEKIRDGRVGKIRGQCGLLAAAGFRISYADMEAHARERNAAPDCLNNKNLAVVALGIAENRELAEGLVPGSSESHGAFIKAFLKENSPRADVGHFRVADYEPSVAECGELARETGGLLSFAHPNFSLEDRGGIPEFLRRIPEYQKLGVEGVELNAKAGPEWADALRKLVAERAGLVLTCGSDWHDDGSREHGELGEPNPAMGANPEWARETEKKFLRRIGG